MSQAELFHALFDDLDDAIAVLDTDFGQYEHVNEGYADFLDSGRSALEGASFVDHAVERTSLDRETVSEGVEAARRGESIQFGCVLEAGDGDRPIELRLDAFGVDGEQRVRSTVRERGELETGDEALEATAQRLNVALAGTNTGVWEWDMETDDVIWTPSMERLFGVEPGTFEGTFEAFAERVHPDDLSAVQAAIETAVEEDDVFQIEYRIRRDDGEQRWGYARGEVHEDGDGSGRIVGIVTDITDHKERELALQRQERQYGELVDRLPEAYYTFDADWTMTYCNEVLAERFDTSVDALRGQTVWEAFPGIRDTALEETFRTVAETDEPASCEYHVEDRGFWVEVQAYPYEDGIAVISSDITERREILSMVLDSMPLIFYQANTGGVLVESRGKGLAKLGVEPGELVGESVFDLYADEPSVIDAFERALDGEEVAFTVELGTDHFQTQLKPIVEDGEVTSVIGVAMDVTELERQREQMEFFNSILRHDVLNGMTVIKARGEILAEQLDGDLGRYARTIVDWCTTTTEVTQRVQRVIETLTTPEDSLEFESVDVSAILDRKLSELSTAHPEITFERDIAPGVQARADELLSEVLGNILLNSIEHNDADGLAISVSVAVDDEIRVRIADNGSGIDDARKESVFRRGETSHVKETGSGFGLFFVDVMVEKYGGEAWVEDSAAGGACFVLELPRATVEAQG